MTNCKCGNSIPKERSDLGFKDCLECSKIEKYGAVDIVYHKTGNTIEIMDAKNAAKINKLSKRSGFGTMHGITKGNKNGTYNPKHTKHRVSLAQIGNEESYEKIGTLSMEEYYSVGLESSFKIIDKASKDLTINLMQANKLKRIINAIHDSLNPKETKTAVMYHNIEFEEKKIDREGIDFAFSSWKINSNR